MGYKGQSEEYKTIEDIINYYEQVFNEKINQIPKDRKDYIPKPEDYKKYPFYEDQLCSRGYIKIANETIDDSGLSRKQMAEVFKIVKRQLLDMSFLEFPCDKHISILRNTSLSHLMLLSCRFCREQINLGNNPNIYKVRFCIFYTLAQLFNKIKEPFFICETNDKNSKDTTQRDCKNRSCVYYTSKEQCDKPSTTIAVRTVNYEKRQLFDRESTVNHKKPQLGVTVKTLGDICFTVSQPQKKIGERKPQNNI